MKRERTQKEDGNLIMTHDTFYEIPSDISALPDLTELEGAIFDIVNNVGAATIRAIANRSRSQGYSQAATALSIRSLVSKGCLVRRSIVVE